MFDILVFYNRYLTFQTNNIKEKRIYYYILFTYTIIYVRKRSPEP